jgi:hypothetical protein
MENWRKVWRDGLGVRMSSTGLEALRLALLHDDARLIQKASTCPPPVETFVGEKVEAACAIGFCGWMGEGLKTVAEVDAFFGAACLAADESLGQPAACRFFLNWFDETPRSEMRRLLLPEVNRLLNQEQRSVA